MRCSGQKIVIDWQYTTNDGNFWHKVFPTSIPVFDKLEDYPDIKNLEHLKRLNKYRKRVGLHKIVLNDDDILELIVLRSV